MNSKAAKYLKSDAVSYETWLLAQIEPTDLPFINCYLDLSVGRTRIMEIIQERKQLLLQNLDVENQTAIDRAFRDLIEDLCNKWPESRSLAIFLRPMEGGRFFKKIELSMPVHISITLQKVPDIVPLVAMQHRHPKHLMVVVDSSSIHVTRMDLGVHHVLYMEQFTNQASLDSRVATSVCALKRVIRKSNDHMVIFGSQDILQPFFKALPPVLKGKVINLLPQSGDQTRKMMREVSWITCGRYREYESYADLCDLVTNMSTGAFHTGLSASMNAMKQAVAHSLYVSLSDIDFHKPHVYREYLNIIRLALQASVPVRFVTAGKLMSHAHGVACLSSSVDSAHMSDTPSTLAA